MLRPIPPLVAWKAIAALVGAFTLVSALGAPVDLWRLTVKSHQGEPFRATATLASLPEERISDACLSMGPDSDAPGSELPFLSMANLKLNGANSTVEISTKDPIDVPALALVLRVQCAGAPLYARHFSALIPPRPNLTRSQPLPVAQPAKRPGFRLSLLPGDTVESVAAVIFPGRRNLQQDLVRRVVAGNPQVFENGQLATVTPGTVLWFPDLREVRNAARGNDALGEAATKKAPSRARIAQSAAPAPAEPSEDAPARPRKPVTLRRALELGAKPSPLECKQLLQLCGAEPTASAGSPSLEEKAQALQSGVKELHLKQDSIDQQLQRLEQSLLAMQKTAASPAPPPVSLPAPPPRVEIRTIEKTVPLPWYGWPAIAGLAALACLGGFLYGRRSSLSRGLAETDEQLDRMLATAATVMRELDSAPRPEPAHRTAEPARPAPPPAAERAVVAPSVSEPEVPAELVAADAVPDIPPAQETANVDVRLESEPPPPQVEGLSTEVLLEMDQALDNTRSMFTDVDRFIALGRTQNALSLLQFQVHKDPKDRDSWIKLLAIYRQENMEAELARTAREFKTHFPHENPPTV